jgi:hypothetical protein
VRANNEVSDNESGGVFLIIGCQRSGTTLTKFVLEAHPAVVCFDEDISYQVLSYSLDRVKQALNHKRWLGFKVPRWTEQLNGPVYRDFCEPAERGAFRDIPKLIFLVRDVRAVVYSMLTTMVGSEPWLHAAGIPILRHNIATRPEFRSRYASQIGYLEKTGYADCAAAALYWLFKTESLPEYERLGFDLMRLHYEELVKEPERSLRRVTSFLQIPWNDRLLRPAAVTHTHYNQDGIVRADYTVARGVDTKSTKRYKGHFSERDLSSICRIAGDLASTLGYDLGDNGYPVHAIARAYPSTGAPC